MKTTVASLDSEGFIGNDASLETSLFEYGLAWKRADNQIEFIYTATWNDRQFNRASICLDNFKSEKEWNWADFGKVASFCGTTKDEFLTRTPEEIVSALLPYYGSLNVFGTPGPHFIIFRE